MSRVQAVDVIYPEQEADRKRTWVPLSPTNIIGTYASPIEVSGFQSTVLSIASKGYTAWVDSDALPLEANRFVDGTEYVVDHGRLYIVLGCMLSEWTIKTKRNPSFILGVERWTGTIVNHRYVLMRDDALDLWLREGKLNPYGILIKVSDIPVHSEDRFKHPSVSVIGGGGTGDTSRQSTNDAAGAGEQPPGATHDTPGKPTPSDTDQE